TSGAAPSSSVRVAIGVPGNRSATRGACVSPVRFIEMPPAPDRDALPDVEEAHPSELGKLRNMGVKHVEPWLMGLVVVPKLDDASLPLGLHDGVDGSQCRIERGAAVVVIEEVGV